MNKKGYIGAIGDDLPSLIPIFLGLMIFFSVFLSTYNIYKDNTKIYSLQNEAISISSTIKEEPLISDYDQFIDTCNKVNSTANWNAFLVNLDMNTDKQTVLNKVDLDQNIIKDTSTNQPFQCKDIGDFQNLNDSKKTIIYMFPITLQYNLHNIPVKLYVVIWN